MRTRYWRRGHRPCVDSTSPLAAFLLDSPSPAPPAAAWKGALRPQAGDRQTVGFRRARSFQPLRHSRSVPEDEIEIEGGRDPQPGSLQAGSEVGRLRSDVTMFRSLLLAVLVVASALGCCPGGLVAQKHGLHTGSRRRGGTAAWCSPLAGLVGVGLIPIRPAVGDLAFAAGRGGFCSGTADAGQLACGLPGQRVRGGRRVGTGPRCERPVHQRKSTALCGSKKYALAPVHLSAALSCFV